MNNSFATVYPQLADRLATEVPALGWVDLDQGQLEGDQVTEYPLPYHAGVALIDFESCEWRDIGQGVQRGDAIIKVTLAVEVVADSYQQSTQRQAALQKLQLLGQVHKALHHFAGESFGALVRVSSHKEQGGPGLWVYAQSYKCQLTDAEGYDGATSTVEGLDVRPRGEFVIQL